MATIEDIGGVGDPLGTPAMGGPTGWAAAVRDAITALQDAAVLGTLVDAKGDLLVATASDTVNRLAVGTDTHVLTADSSAATGVKWAAAPGGGTGLVDSSRVKRTAGNLVFNTTGWQDVSTSLDMTIAASAGDLIEYGLSAWAASVNNTLAFDVCTVVSGSPVNYFATAGGATENGLMAWYTAASVTAAISGSADYVVQSGDISGGNVTLRLRVRPANTTARTVEANSLSPLMVWCRNYGPA